MPWFALLGFDVPDFEESLDPTASDELDEAHWAYMDLVADRLLARGPMMTVDHDGHTGSIHILRAHSYADAEAFAMNEPYFLAGMYERLEVTRFDSWLKDTMWDRIGDPSAGRSWLVVRRCSNAVVPNPPNPLGIPDSVLCGGWMLAPDGESTHGAIVLLDAPGDVVTTTLNTLTQRLPDYADQTIPWRRGGRM
jgi:uncharacterized protein